MGFLDLARGHRRPEYSAARTGPRMPASMMPELAVVLATPGFTLGHWCRAFGWAHPTRPWAIELAKAADPELVKANALSMVLEDGLDWVRAILHVWPGYSGSVPLWTALALRESHITAVQLGVKPYVLSKWRSPDASLSFRYGSD